MEANAPHTPPPTSNPSADAHLLFTPPCVDPALLHTPALDYAPPRADSTSLFIHDDVATHDWTIEMDTADEVDELDSSFAATPTQSQQSPLLLSPSPLSSRVRKLRYSTLVDYASDEGSDSSDCDDSMGRANSVPPPPSTPLEEQVGSGRREKSLPPPETPTRLRVTRIPTTRAPELVKEGRQHTAPLVANHTSPLFGAASLLNSAPPVADPTPSLFSAALNSAPPVADPTPSLFGAAPLLASPAAPLFPKLAAPGFKKVFPKVFPKRSANPSAKVTAPSIAKPSTKPLAKPSAHPLLAPPPQFVEYKGPSDLFSPEVPLGALTLSPSAPTPARATASSDQRLEARLQDEGFAEVTMPPPPLGWQPSSPLRLTTIDHTEEEYGTPAMQEEDAPVMEGEAFDGAADGSAADGSPYSKQARALALQECFAKMTSLADECADKVGFKTETVLRLFNDVPMAGRSANQWNLYQKYANADENRAEERARVDEAFQAQLAADPNTVAERMSSDELCKAYPAFQQAYPGADAMELLENWNELELLGTELTIGMQRKHFNRTGKKLISTLRTLSKRYRYQSFLVLVGSHVNEDSELGLLHTSGGLDSIYSKLPSVTSPHEFLGLAKVQAYCSKIWFSLLGGEEDAEAAEASAPSCAQAAVSSAELLKARRMAAAPKAEELELGNLQGAARVQMKNKIRHQREADETHTLQDALTKASTADIGYDVFRKNRIRAATFQWQFGPILRKKSVRILGWPHDVRFPPETRGISVLRAAERKSLFMALDAREIAGQGLRLEKRQDDASYVVYTHNYDLDPPAGKPDSPAVVAFWRTSSGKEATCMDGANALWRTKYNVDAPHPPTASRQRVATEISEEAEAEVGSTKGKGKSKGKARVQKGVEDKSAALPKEKGKRNGSGKRRADDDDELDTRARKARKRSPPADPAPSRSRSRAAVQEGGGRKPKPQAAKSRRVRFANSPESSSDDDIPESQSEDDTPLDVVRPKRKIWVVADSDEEEEEEEEETPPTKHVKQAADASAASATPSAAAPSPRQQFMSHVDVGPVMRSTCSRTTATPAAMPPPAAVAPKSKKTPSTMPAPAAAPSKSKKATSAPGNRSKSTQPTVEQRDLDNAVIHPIVPGPTLYAAATGKPIGRIYTDPAADPSYAVGPPPGAASSSRSHELPANAPHRSPPPSAPPTNAHQPSPPPSAPAPAPVDPRVLEALTSLVNLTAGGDHQAILDALKTMGQPH
ncbi:hypothetical protein B0H13DRAFT_2303124 [Mycena leptocephala]|nr:hypothetical protein B0H13DRAFT_2303124 [Mycena leptocephala]